MTDPYKKVGKDTEGSIYILGGAGTDCRPKHSFIMKEILWQMWNSNHPAAIIAPSYLKYRLNFSVSGSGDGGEAWLKGE